MDRCAKRPAARRALVTLIRVVASIAFTAFLTGVASSAAAQGQITQVQSALDSTITTIAGEIAAEKARDPRATIPPGEVNLFTFRGLQGGSLVRLLQDYEEQRTDEQVGASSSASGTTTLVSKGAVPEVLALAVENGAIAKTESGTTMTFRGNLGGVIDALANKGFLQMMSHGSDPARDLVKRLSFSASFDTSRGSDITTFTGDQQQLSQWSARIQVLNRRDPMRAEYRQRWQALTAGPQSSLAQASGGAYAALSSDPAFQIWLSEARAAVAAATAASVESTLFAQMARFPVDALNTATRRALAEYDRVATSFVRERQRVLDDIASGGQVALEFTSDRPVFGPQTSNIRLIGGLGGSADLTGNASVTLFDKLPPGARNRIRDIQVAGEVGVKLGSAATTGPFVLALSGRYLYQSEDSISDAGTMIPNTAGKTVFGQAKLTIPVKGSGVKIPLSITYANRTDLLNESIVRGNVGITYDLDSVFARFKP